MAQAASGSVNSGWQGVRLLGDAGELGKRVVELCAWREQWGPRERVCGSGALSLPRSLRPRSRCGCRRLGAWSVCIYYMTKGARAGARGSFCELQLCAYSAPARNSGVPLVRPQLSRSSVSVPSGADSGPGHRGIARPDFPRNAQLRVLILHPGRSLIILISGVVPGIDPHCLNL